MQYCRERLRLKELEYKEKLRQIHLQSCHLERDEENVVPELIKAYNNDMDIMVVPELVPQFSEQFKDVFEVSTITIQVEVPLLAYRVYESIEQMFTQGTRLYISDIIMYYVIQLYETRYKDSQVFPITLFTYLRKPRLTDVETKA